MNSNNGFRTLTISASLIDQEAHAGIVAYHDVWVGLT